MHYHNEKLKVSGGFCLFSHPVGHINCGPILPLPGILYFYEFLNKERKFRGGTTNLGPGVKVGICRVGAP